MNVLICDDQANETARLAALVQGAGFDVNTAVFNNGYDALDHIQSGAEIDVCFLDIVMPGLSGIALAGSLRDMGFTGSIVFLTASNEFAAESYRVKALSYLLKPVSPDAVKGILRELESAKRKGDAEGIFLKFSTVARFLLFRDISYVEVMGHYVYFRLVDGEELELYATFRDIAGKLLSDRRFVQCHRSHLVNMGEIAAIDDWQILLRSGKRLPISKRYPDVKRKFARWVVGVDRA